MRSLLVFVVVGSAVSLVAPGCSNSHDAPGDLGTDALACNAPQTICGGECVDLTNDERHCGECVRACGPDSECQASACVCPGDPPGATCGRCGTICGASESCIGGRCVAGTQALWVVGRLIVPPVSNGVVIGFDLDDHVSAAADAEGCGFRDRISPAGVPGIDNELAALVPFIDPLLIVINPTFQSTQWLLDEAIRRGEILLGIVLTPGTADGLVNASVYDLLTESGMRPNVDANGILPDQSFVLDGDPLIAVTDADVQDGTLELGPFDTAISLFTLAVPFVGTRLVLDVGTRAGEGITGGTTDPRPIVNVQPAADALLRRDMVLPNEAGCLGMSTAFFVNAVPGTIAP